MDDVAIATPDEEPDESEKKKNKLSGRLRRSQKATRKSQHRITDEEMGEALIACAGQATLAAKMLGCHHSTIYDRLKQKPAMREVVEGIRKRNVQAVYCVLLAEALKPEKTGDRIYFLKTQAKYEDFGHAAFIERSELTGANGGPLQLQAVKNAEEMTDDELAMIAAGEKPRKPAKPAKEPDRPGDPIRETEARATPETPETSE